MIPSQAQPQMNCTLEMFLNISKSLFLICEKEKTLCNLQEMTLGEASQEAVNSCRLPPTLVSFSHLLESLPP